MRVLIEMERLEAQGEAMVWCLACTTEESGVFTAFPHPDVRLIYPYFFRALLMSLTVSVTSTSIRAVLAYSRLHLTPTVLTLRPVRASVDMLSAP